MGVMDDMKRMGDIGDLRARFEELKSKEQAGNLDDDGRKELSELRARFER